MKKEEYITVGNLARKVFDSLPVGTEFTGLELKRWCVALHPEFTDKYVDSFLKRLRETRREQFICLDCSKSKYKKVAV